MPDDWITHDMAIEINVHPAGSLPDWVDPHADISADISLQPVSISTGSAQSASFEAQKGARMELDLEKQRCQMEELERQLLDAQLEVSRYAHDLSIATAENSRTTSVLRGSGCRRSG